MSPPVRRRGGAVALKQVAVALAVAVAAAPVLRGATAGLNRTLGPVWPFSLAHCLASASPGCGPRAPRLAAGPSAWCGRHECVP